MIRASVESHFDNLAKDYDYYKKRNAFYYENIKLLLSSLIPKNKKVLEVGCGTGDLLANLKPKKGFGMDLSSRMIKIASQKHKGIRFSTNYPKEKYEYIFMTDVIEHVENPGEVLKKISDLMGEDGVFINTMANPIWEPLLMFWEKMGWKMPEGPHKRLSFKEINYLINKSGMKVVKHDYKLLIPVKIPIITEFANKYLEKIFKKLAFIEYFVVIKA